MTNLNTVFGKGFSLSGYYGTIFSSGSAPASGAISYSTFSGKSAAQAITTIPNTVGGLPLLLWLDGSDQTATSMTISGGRVSLWKNKSGTSGYSSYSFSNTGYNGGGPTLSNVGPTYTAPYFTLSNALKNTSILLPNTYTIFAVANQQAAASTGNGYIIFAPPDNIAGLAFGTLANGHAFASFGGGGVTTAWQSVSTNTPSKDFANTPTTASLASCTNSGTVLIPYFNGVAQDSRSFTYGSVTGMCIGDVQIPNQPWIGGIGEIVIFSNVLSTTYRQKIEGYLCWKWGIQANLPSGHPYLNSAPTNFN